MNLSFKFRKIGLYLGPVRSLMQAICTSFSLVIVCSCSHFLTIDKVQGDMNSLKSQTYDIMNRLEFPIRTKIYKDDSLKTTVFTGKMMTCVYHQEAIAPYSISKGIDTNNRWYIKPEISISAILDSVVSGKKDTTREAFIKALGSMIHELTHYLQNEYISNDQYIEGTIETFQPHFFQPTEFQAYAVNAYYILNFRDKKYLRSVMRSKLQMREKCLFLLRRYIEIEIPALLERLDTLKNLNVSRIGT